MSTDVLLVGAGNLGTALAQGWLLPEPVISSLTILTSSGQLQDERVAKHPLVKSVTKLEKLPKETIVVLAVKPGVIRQAYAHIKAALNENQRVVSVAAGVRLDKIGAMDPKRRWSRAMPSVAAAYRESFTTLYRADPVVTELFSDLGTVLKVDNENAVDLATVVGACGPGVMAFLAQSWLEAGHNYGLDQKDMQRMLANMFTSTGTLLAHSNDFGQLVSKVATKGGMTDAMIGVLSRGQATKETKSAIEAALGKALAMNSAF